MNYLFLKYNNYYNRIIKQEDSIDAYIEATPVNDDDDHLFSKVYDYNFQEGDMVSSEITVNWSDDWFPDYLVCFTGKWPADEIISSRWFILETVRTRKGQYKMTLRRDVITDNRSAVDRSTLSISRCKLPDTSPLIYNSEGMSFNEIKQEEVAVYDRTGCPWIVGYFANSLNLSREIATNTNYDIDLSTTAHTSWTYYDKLGTHDNVVSCANTVIDVTWNSFNYGHVGYMMAQNRNANWLNSAFGQIGTNYINFECSTEARLNAIKDANRRSWIDWDALELLLKTKYETLTDSNINDIIFYNGRKILFSDGVYEVSFYRDSSKVISVSDVDDDITKKFLGDFSTNCTTDITTKKAIASYAYTVNRYILNMTKVEDAKTIKYSIPTTANKLIDAPYKMFCIPYPNATGSSPSLAIDDLDIDKNMMLNIAMDIVNNTVTSGDSANLYDIQILPYCPMDFTYTSQDATICKIASKPSWVTGIDYSNITYDHEEIIYDEESGQTYTETVTDTIGYIFFPKESSFTFSLDYLLGKSISYKFRVTNKKIQNETQKLRLCASNYSSIFEFNLAKNNGLSALNISCTYKPYNPFIQVQPNFGGLYGGSYTDNRGLICAGDYSLPIVNSAWTSYELTNKTYQESFNREITHMEVGNEIAKTNAIINSITGTIQGTATGAYAGSKVGGAGAIVGAAAGGTLSAAGGVADYMMLTKQQKEDISYKKDMFNFNLQNIKALPNTLAKTSAINSNSKYVPFIEIYDCTDEEKEILAEYLKWNGMTAGYAGTLPSEGYVQANIIRFEGLTEVHEVNEINNELLKGVYLE